MNIPFIDLNAQQERIRPQVERAITKVLDHGAYIMGPEVFELEQELSDYCGVKHTLSCSSGTDALVLALLALEVSKSDAIFVPTFTFAATAEAAVFGGGTPVFVDVDPGTFNICGKSLIDAIQLAKCRGLTPRVVVAVDLFGQPADYDLIEQICLDHNLILISDAAQSFGGKWKNRNVGSIGHIACTSFFPAKPLGCYGDGGAVFTNDDRLIEILRSLRVHGQGTDKYQNIRIGMTGRLDTIQAAVLLEKLKIFDAELDARQKIAERYTAGLREYVETPFVMDCAYSAWAQYTILLENRDKLSAILKEAGIPTMIYYPQIIREQKPYAEYPFVKTPVANMLSAKVLSLPMHPYLAHDTQNYIIDNIVNAMKEDKRCA